MLKNFNKGWQNSIGTYCTTNNGYQLGIRGQAAPNVCPRRFKARFMDAWNRGARIYCRKTANAFALGKSGQGYPAACDANVYPAFHEEYVRGQAVQQRIGQLQGQANDMNGQIDAIVAATPNLHRDGDSITYNNVGNITANDRQQMYRSLELVKQKQRLQNDIYRAQQSK